MKPHLGIRTLGEASRASGFIRRPDRPLTSEGPEASPGEKRLNRLTHLRYRRDELARYVRASRDEARIRLVSFENRLDLSADHRCIATEPSQNIRSIGRRSTVTAGGDQRVHECLQRAVNDIAPQTRNTRRLRVARPIPHAGEGCAAECPSPWTLFDLGETREAVPLGCIRPAASYTLDARLEVARVIVRRHVISPVDSHTEDSE